MDKTDGVKWFMYTLFNAWAWPLADITVFQTDKFFVEYEIHTAGNREPQAGSIEISDSTMDKIKVILSNKRLYEIEKLEDPYTTVGVNIFDGYLHYFYFNNGEQNIVLQEGNIAFCRGQYEKCPNTALVIDILEELGKVLIPEGVDEKCFKLTWA